MWKLKGNAFVKICVYWPPPPSPSLSHTLLKFQNTCSLTGSSHVSSGESRIEGGHLLDDHHWHLVSFKRNGYDLSLEIDGVMVTNQTNGPYVTLDINQQVRKGRNSVICIFFSFLKYVVIFHLFSHMIWFIWFSLSHINTPHSRIPVWMKL